MNHISNFDIQSLTLGENEPLAVTNRGTMASPAHNINFSGSASYDTVRLLKDEPILKESWCVPDVMLPCSEPELACLAMCDG